MTTMVKNPILRGFNPDPSVLKVGDDYFLATSTFEWWPGVEIYHSRDLVNWKLVAEPLNDPEQVPLRGVDNSQGIWAPNLSYSLGKYWLTYTIVRSGTAFKDTLNYVIMSAQIDGPWSKPTFVTASGFDPAFFHDDDGKHYFINMLFNHRLEAPGFDGVVIQEFNAKTMQLVGQRQHFFAGTELGVCEGPQIMKKSGWYYLLCAAGGTGYSHASTVARSRKVVGPYELSPYTPLISTKHALDNPLQKCGHASFIEVSPTEWYISFLCARPLTKHGNCVLGRETAIQPIEWVADWPRLKNKTVVPDINCPAPSIAATSVQKLDYSQRYDFDKEYLSHDFKTLRGPLTDQLSLTARPGYCRLYGRESLSSHHFQSLIARRWQAVSFRAETQIDFQPQNFQQLAGLVLYYDTDNWAYLYMSYDMARQRRYLQVEVADANQFSYYSDMVEVSATGTVKLAVTVDHAQAQFAYRTAETWQPIGRLIAADHLSDDYIRAHQALRFTGAMVGICAQDMDQHQSFADFDYFDYQE
ncbi:glycoside hydrolase family 43 protein [Lactiplantibacillus daoliensis]|uniref:Glycoside hydrolase family 43 protein n=1 Tax=Lactiplantibacillus daoliensis TaxID=2559916 RepID=A0ABW1UGG7_9LACO|nr:glycoside hydrolase family 43 protein [Lactiplantibacillus daoliensis]